MAKQVSPGVLALRKVVVMDLGRSVTYSSCVR